MKFLSRNSLQHSIFFFTLLIVFVPLVSLGIISYSKHTDNIVNNVKRADENTVDQIVANITFFLGDIHDLSLFIIQSSQAQNLLTSNYEKDSNAFLQEKRQVEELLVHLIGSKEYIKSIQVQDQSDILINTNGVNIPISNKEKQDLLKLNGKAAVIEGEDGPSIRYTRLVKNIHDITEVIGYITVELNLEYISDLFQTEDPETKDTYFW
ncbi:hypothetical protein G4V62_10820 [Bacillaceae bacterium SIJ1]|uniref:hypothetical protein n=1 Tax=Litoribacterium kuwaitense TaxID=1398745 RepID=UPI0013ECF15F|nr:hypothetical protein [Litoribacterium kuwaitense]NGP45424.1 hypothetical protein [Litoribacterium kuwaitense]